MIDAWRLTAPQRYATGHPLPTAPLRYVAVLAAILFLAAPERSSATPLQLLEQTADGFVLLLDLPAFELTPAADGPGTGDRISIPHGFDTVDEEGLPSLPFASAAIAVPAGATVDIDILDADVLEYDAIRLDPRTAVNDSAGAPHAPSSVPLTEIEELGLLRGVRTAALRVYPFQYDAARRQLTVYERLRIAVRFRGGESGHSADKRSAASQFENVLFSALLNPGHIPDARTPMPAYKPLATTEWYDPAAPWVKLFVDKDALHRIDANWLAARQVDVDAIDPRSFRLFLLGEEQFVHVAGQEDGHFDADDHLLFSGRYRRVDGDEPGTVRDFESIYGKRNTYWLTWGGEAGQRFVEKSGAPVNGYSESDWHWATAHFEQDLWYQQFPEAPDNDRDHWFWKRDPIRGNEVETPGSAVFVDELQTPYLEDEYTAAVRVALHGATPGHHTVLKLNNQEFEDSVWDEQVEKVFENEIPSSYLRNGTNRLTVQAFASPTQGRDVSFFNWFAIDYRKRYGVWLGYLAFEEPASTGKRISVTNLTLPEIELLDVANGIRFVDLGIDSVLVDSVFVRYTATFEDEPSAPARYVIADRAFISAPLGLLDTPSRLRSANHRADYLIITNSRFVAAAQRLADHRRSSGLEVEIAVMNEIYDEFSFGLMKREAIREFIRYAYRDWETPPVYVLLLGDATYDYRNIIGGGEPSFVPTLYYHARDRGHSPNDYLYALLDGDDDSLPDLAVGRLAVESAEQAEWTVDRIIGYDEGPEPGNWRSRALYVANFQEKNIFSDPSDSLAARYTEPFGLSSVKVYNPDHSPVPNLTGRHFLDALNAGALTVNFAGHGSAGNMQFVFALQFPDWDYLSHVRNGQRLPFITALSCLNGMFVNPVVDGLAEVFTTVEDGGAIAFVSATAISRVLENDSLSNYLYDHFFRQGNLQFGPTLNASKVSVLAAHSSYTASVLTMQLFGDPAQELALPLSPDYEALRLATAEGDVLSTSALTLEATLRNNSPITADSLTVAILGRQSDGGSGEVDTLLFERRPSFAGSDTLRVPWTLDGRHGSYDLDFLVDPDNVVTELEESNNSTSLTINILQADFAEPVFPPHSAALAARELSLEASVPASAALGPGSVACEFAISAAPEFPPQNTLVSAPVTAVNGRSVFVPTSLPEAETSVYFWRARIASGPSVGPWSSPVRSFSLRNIDGAAETAITWKQAGAQFTDAEIDHLELDAQGQLGVATVSLPMRPSSATREDGFTVRDLEGSGVVCTDGTYLYAKRWFNDASTIYPGSDFFARIGSGFNDTRRDLLYEFLADSTTAGISATYHSDGYIYNESGRAYELERLSVESGRLDTVEVAAGLLEWKYGRVEDGHSLITSDGRHIYNVSMSSAAGTRTGWGVRVFDPANDWELVREFTSPPTETGFTFEWTDGVVADGERLYFIEFGGERRIRMVDAEDGSFLDEWHSDQDTTRVISGQYDWVNDKLWLGDLFSSAIFRYSGVTRFDAGTIVSEPVGPARAWRWARVESTSTAGGLRVDVQVEDGDGNWTTAAGVGELQPGSTDLGNLDATRYRRLRLSAHLDKTAGTAVLDSWEIEYEASPVVEIAATAAEVDSLGLHLEIAMQNRSPAAAMNLELTVEQLDANGRFHPFVERRAASLDRGETRHVLLDSLPLPALGARLFASLSGEGLYVEDPESRVEIILPVSSRLPQIRFSLWPDDRLLLDDDPLLPGQVVLISGPAQLGSSDFAITIDGQRVEADSLFAAAADTGLRALIGVDLSAGPHEVRVELLADGEVLSVGTLKVTVATGLVMANLLIYPHPVADETAFTYVLSHDAEVTVEVFSLAGRLVRRLQSGRQVAGFQQTNWDGRSDSGQPLATGTYLCRVIARSADRTVEHRRPLTVLR